MKTYKVRCPLGHERFYSDSDTPSTSFCNHNSCRHSLIRSRIYLSNGWRLLNRSPSATMWMIDGIIIPGQQTWAMVFEEFNRIYEDIVSGKTYLE